MSTRAFTVPLGAPVSFRPGGQPFSICAQPGAGGSVLIDYSIDNGTTFTPALPGSIAGPYSFTLGGQITSPAGAAPFGAGVPQSGIVRVTPTTAAGSLIACELQPLAVAGLSGLSLIANFNGVNGASYASQNSTNEQTLFSMRFPPGYFPLNFSLFADIGVSCTNSANAKTLKAYFGPTSYSSSTLLEGGTSLGSEVYTSMAGGVSHYQVSGRGDFQSLIGGNIGVTGAGYGTSTTANVTISTANYGGPTAVEQVLTVTVTKATGSETFSLDSIRVFLGL